MTTEPEFLRCNASTSFPSIFFLPSTSAGETLNEVAHTFDKHLFVYLQVVGACLVVPTLFRTAGCPVTRVTWVEEASLLILSFPTHLWAGTCTVTYCDKELFNFKIVDDYGE